MLVDPAAKLGRDPAELLLDVVAADGTAASMLIFCMAPEDVRRVLRHSATVIGSDGWVLDPRPGTHPRNFQTFPQMLHAAFRDEVGLDLVDAVARMTSDVATRFGIEGRGAVTPGFAADLVAFDPATVAPGGDLGDPAGAPRGIEAVLVNGVVTSSRPGLAARSPRAGRVLRRSSTVTR
jgi:N-acyl-D-amino-acid deacylase